MTRLEVLAAHDLFHAIGYFISVSDLRDSLTERWRSTPSRATCDRMPLPSQYHPTSAHHEIVVFERLD